ncbi:hypothetical protein DPMN_171223 [Dreissena polymorpha]|uniref:Uncharacterized protein n=1 Tax=Dreissena polymorpha TaxID=45954 RepID=A0A9D4DXP2_DREPO|nr:hypothetical protein DPMN_171223 [Dreissena polymorpha]
MARQRPTRLVMGPCILEIDLSMEVNRCRNEEVNFQGSSAYSVGGDSGQDGQTDRQTNRQTDRRTAEITTISPRFLKSKSVTDRQTDSQTHRAKTISPLR